MSQSHSQAHRSSVSQHSHSVSQFINEVEELSDAELIKQVSNLKQQIRMLTLENEIFEKTILRLDPTLMHGLLQALEYATKLQSSSSLNVGSFVKSQTSRFNIDSLISPSRMLTSPSKVSTKRVESSAKVSGTVIFGSGPRVNVLERSELVSIQMEILISNLEKARNKAAKNHALLRAQLEEISVRVGDVEKSEEMFNQMVLVEGWDKIAQRIPAEIWLRYMSEWMKITDSQIGKLRLRTSTLNTQYSKFKGQIKVKAELSESLRAVDFEKLKIENKECLEIIEKKLQQLGELKKMTGDANLNLTVHKKAMMEQNAYLSKILDAIKRKQKQTVELDKERAVIEQQADGLAQQLNAVQRARATHLAPDVLEYTRARAAATDLRRSVALLGNSLRVQQNALTALNNKQGCGRELKTEELYRAE